MHIMEFSNSTNLYREFRRREGKKVENITKLACGKNQDSELIMKKHLQFQTPCQQRLHYLLRCNLTARKNHSGSDTGTISSQADRLKKQSDHGDNIRKTIQENNYIKTNQTMNGKEIRKEFQIYRRMWKKPQDQDGIGVQDHLEWESEEHKPMLESWH